MFGTLVLLGALLAVFQAASGDAPAAVETPAPPPCPDADAVWAAAVNLLGSGRRPTPAVRATLAVEDLGARYRVSIAGHSREVTDDAHDCARRAQVAAVFVALTLAPPEVPLQSEAPSPPPPPPPPRSPPPAVTARVELAPWAGLNVLGTDDRAFVGGGLVRACIFASGARIGALVDASIGLGAAEASTAGRVRERRFPLAAGARWTWQGRRIEGGVDLELVAAWLEVAPTGGASTGGTVDWGGRLGGILALGEGRIMPLLGAFVEASVAPPALALEPDGVVGRASSLRVGAFAGLGLRIP